MKLATGYGGISINEQNTTSNKIFGYSYAKNNLPYILKNTIHFSLQSEYIKIKFLYYKVFFF